MAASSSPHGRLARRRELLLVAALLAPLVLVALSLGWRSVEVYENVDAGAFVKRAGRLAATGEILATRDPPLRYVLLAAIYGVVSPSAALAGRIAHLYGALCSFVLTPLALYALVRVCADWRAGALSILGFVALRVLGIGTLPYYGGSFQYSSAIPVALLALLAVQLAITRPSATGRRRWALAAGGLLGVVGLTQYTVAAFAIASVTLAYLAARRYRELVFTGAVGAVCATPLLFISSRAENQIGSVTRRVGESIDMAPASIAAEFVVLLTTPGTLFFIALGALAAVLYWRTRMRPAGSYVLTSAVVVCGVVWAAGRLIGAGHLPWIAYVVGQYALVGILGQQIVAWGDQQPMVDGRTGLSRLGRCGFWAVVVSATLVAAVALLAAVPRYAP